MLDTARHNARASGGDVCELSQKLRSVGNGKLCRRGRRGRAKVADEIRYSKINTAVKNNSEL